MKQTGFSNDIIDPNTHGGKRRGAGRKRRVDEGAHQARPQIDGKNHPLHITVRLREGLPSLRKNKTFRRLQSFMKQAQTFGLRVNHFSVLGNHIHMIAEVDGTKSLKKGMMSFNGRLGRWLRKQGEKRPGEYRKKYHRGLFKRRYHVQVLKHPRQMKNALKYVLLNASKHFRKCLYIDQFSSAACFRKWPQLLKNRFDGLIQAQVLSLAETGGGEKDQSVLIEGLAPPSTWLGAVGWLRRG